MIPLKTLIFNAITKGTGTTERVGDQIFVKKIRVQVLVHKPLIATHTAQP